MTPGEIDMSNSYEAARLYYQAELAAGVERFLEPRRDSCPWCGSTDLSVRLRTTDLHQRKPGRFILDQCGRCRHIFQNPRLNPAGLDFYYRDFYDGLGQQTAELLFKLQAPNCRGRAEMLRPFTAPKAWLDVGTGYGHFCQFARKVWPDTVFDGLDLGGSVEEAQRRGWVHHAYRGEFVALADELAGRYDVLSMHHYLEHTREPLDELDIAAKVLLPGGYLLIEVPDPNYRIGRVFGRMWSQWCQPQHQHMFPLDNLVRALADRGLSLVAVERGEAHLMGADLFASLGLLLNVCARNPKLPWLPAEPTRWRRVRCTTVWAVGRPLLAGAAIIDWLLSQVVRRTRNGNVYRVLACKHG
jgi:SAM-dependent methyltransferase